MEELLKRLRQRFPELTYRPGDVFCWSPENREVCYVAKLDNPQATWSLLHETGHALLEHRSFSTDLALLLMEVAAWEKTKELARELAIAIDDDHIQDCLDTYRDWVYARSICPRCHSKALQQTKVQRYHCFNCHMVWKVTPSRFCRPYRATEAAVTSSIDLSQTAENF